MGFWKNLFSKKTTKEEITEENWDQVVYNHRDVNFRNQEQRTSYITTCLEQMAEASGELDILTSEYSMVTSYLTDMEEIESLPPSSMERIRQMASGLDAMNTEMQKFQGRKNRLTDKEFYSLRKQEAEVEEGIKKIREEEHRAVLIKKDLRRLDGERHAYTFRRQELENAENNLRGMAVIFLAAFGALVVLLLVLQFVLKMEVFVGYFLAIAAVAIAMTAISVKYMDAERDRVKVGENMNRLISLQNTVKIRYVNNRKLLQYLYMKYDVESGEKLQKLWVTYQKEKEDRRQYTETEAKADYYRKELISGLANCRVRDPERWADQPKALLDKREMVEIRHGLILRRQTLREQMDYNRALAETAKNEIMEVAREYPEYAAEILQMADDFEDSKMDQHE